MRYQFWGLLISLVLLSGCGSNTSGTSDSAQPKAQTASDSNEVGSVSAMGAGDIYYVDFDSNGNAAIDMTAGDAEAKYTLIVQATDTTYSSVTITASDISASVSDSFNYSLREADRRNSESMETIYEAPLLQASVSKAVGDSSTFRVLTSISGSTYTDITATSKCVKDHIITYMDNALPTDTFTASDISTLCEQFEHAAAIEETYLGETSDVNSDGHVAVLITPQVNALGGSGGGIITGYFYSSDLYPRSELHPTSNEMEIIYVVAPDPDGTYGAEISKEFAMSNYLPAVVPHELQHAISFNQHFIVNGGSSEENWLNEGMSHFAEDLVGFGQENPSRMVDFLEYPEFTPLVSSSPSLAERGAEYLFIRYLYERANDPEAFLAGLENTPLTGESNIIAAFAGADANFDEWNEMMRRWAIALALTDTGISSTAQYQYNERTSNDITSNWEGACLICDADDGRGTVLTGPYMEPLSSGTLNLSLSGTATAFYSIETPPTTISLYGTPSTGLQGVLIRTE